MKRRTLVAAAGILAIAGSIPLSALAAEKTIVVGVTAGPHAEIMEVVKRIAEKQGMKIRIVEFNDFVQPNAALVAGDLDINSFQHKPYMDQQNEDRGYKLASAAPTITFPLTYYTRKGYKTLADLPQGARVGIPNDPTNANRALHMLEEQGLVRLNPKAGIRATVLDIIDNAKKLRIIELDSAQLPRSLEDLDAAAINASYAKPAGLARQGRHRPRTPRRPLRQHPLRPRRGPLQALGRQVRPVLPLPRSQGICRKALQRGHDLRLVMLICNEQTHPRFS